MTMLLRISCLANIFIRPAGPLASWLYGASLTLAFAHLPVAPRLLIFEREIKNEESSPAESLQGLQKWLSINNVRLLAVDLPLWVTTAIAVVESVLAE
jgi:hypothetical protein